MKSKAHFFYYTQIRIGVCLTTHCDLEDVSSMVKTSKGIKISLDFFCSENEFLQSVTILLILTFSQLLKECTLKERLLGVKANRQPQQT